MNDENDDENLDPRRRRRKRTQDWGLSNEEKDLIRPLYARGKGAQTLVQQMLAQGIITWQHPLSTRDYQNKITHFLRSLRIARHRDDLHVINQLIVDHAYTPDLVIEDDNRPFLIPTLPKAFVALDLDDTIVHATQRMDVYDRFNGEKVQFTTASSGKTINLLVRPHARDFLGQIAALYNVIIFTVGDAEYAAKIQAHLDPAGTLFSGCLSRTNCTLVDNELGKDAKTLYTKDLRKVSADVCRVLLVDNTKDCFVHQPLNGILVKTWLKNQADRELLRLASFLEEHAGVEDMRLLPEMWVV
ncbi:NLI interacting factor-like phosphatase-domain-containing protein [Catenaria anguillulae PL171]|uniref:Mitochondrial import inner membrane translocase subunit TIM50 n=1 Tax=Catenaria anguillulae PL171 TaxID=765915 RepID=A0A1Y2HJD4_9FUNG|nr:NLI interacting factor-like phosphatase-domain-containing protein [Catenaria anguillulae PL171]